VLTNHLAYLRPKSEAAKAKKGTSVPVEFIGEYQSVLEQDFFDFVLCEVPWIVY
jgi:V-type H+-transporting ATPase subunit C